MLRYAETHRLSCEVFNKIVQSEWNMKWLQVYSYSSWIINFIKTCSAVISYMHTDGVIATGVLQRCDHTYIAYVVGIIICIYPLHTVAKIGTPQTPWWGEVPCIRERLLTTQLLNLLWVPLDWVPFLWEKAVFWIPVITPRHNFTNNYSKAPS
jgi:hypothetical protein